LFIIPGFGVAGISGIILVIFSIYTATVGLSGETVTDRLIPDSDGDWVIVQAWLTTFLTMLVVGVAGAFVAARSLHRLPLIGSAFVSPSERMTGLTQPGGVTAHGRVKLHLGARGLTDTDLRPAGRASFGTDMLDVVSEGGWVRKGVAVEVVLVEGHRVVVAPADTAGSPDPTADPEGTE